MATVIVVLGVVIEVIATALEVRDELKSGGKVRIHHILTFAGGALVVLAVAGEFWAEMKAASVETELRTNNALEQAILADSSSTAIADVSLTIAQYGGLDKYVRTRTKAINDELSALKTAEDRARTALAKIDPLAAKEVALIGAIASDQKRLNGHEARLTDQEEKQEKNRNQLGELETETHEFETENIERGLALDANRTAASLMPYADVPIYLSLHDDPETLQFGNLIKLLIRTGTGKEPKIARDSFFNLAPGVHVFFERAVNFRKMASGTGFVEPREQSDHQRAAAMAVCRELQSSKVSGAVAEMAMVDEGGIFTFSVWDKAVPKNAILIRVGPAIRPLIDRRRAELNGREKLLESIEQTNKSNEEAQTKLGRKGPCDPVPL